MRVGDFFLSTVQCMLPTMYPPLFQVCLKWDLLLSSAFLFSDTGTDTELSNTRKATDTSGKV